MNVTDESVVEADATVQYLIDRLVEARAAKAEAEQDEKDARAALEEAFSATGAREFTVHGRKAAALVLNRRTGLDQDILRRLAPKALEKARKVTEYHTLRLTR